MLPPGQVEAAQVEPIVSTNHAHQTKQTSWESVWRARQNPNATECSHRSPVSAGEVEHCQCAKGISIRTLRRCDHLRMEFTSRLATFEDVPRLIAVMDDAIAELQRAFLDDEQIEASRAVMGIDTQLIEDGTYFVVETPDGDVAGCGGWSRRGTMYGNDHSPGRDAKLLDPAVDAAPARSCRRR